MKYKHTPVMLKEVLGYLNPRTGDYFIDCTLGGAGYTIAIAERIGKNGKIIAIDADALAIENAKLQITQALTSKAGQANHKLHNVILVQNNFKNLLKITKKYFNNKKVNGIVFDLGLSTAQLEDQNRGFSFQKNAPLKMEFGIINQELGKTTTTEYIVNHYKEKELEKIIKEYGEERFAKKIAEKIVKYRKNRSIKTTKQLVEIVESAVPKKFLYSRLHPATRTFQALRIATNNELENLKLVLPQALDLLIKNGRLVIISYHSLEDRIVKQFFKKEAKNCLCPPNYPACRCQHQARLTILTKKVIRATKEEVLKNVRARSAKLRAAEKI